MKVRTDFVTNSSSSSFVTVIIETKDGEKIRVESSLDDIGHGVDPVPIALMDDEDILKMLEPVESGEQLVYALDKQYDGMYRRYPLTEEQLKKISKSDYLREQYEKENQDNIKAVKDFNNVEKITIADYWHHDTGDKAEKVFVYDPSSKSGESIEDSSDINEDEWEEVDEAEPIEKKELMNLLGISSLKSVKHEHVKEFLKEYSRWDVCRQQDNSISIWYSGPFIGEVIEQKDFTIDRLEKLLAEIMTEIQGSN